MVTLIFVVIFTLLLMGVSIPFIKFYQGTHQAPPAEIDLLNKHFRDFSYFSRDGNFGSRAACSVAKIFREIPAHAEPFSGNELARTLQALDLKWGDRTWEHGFRVSYLEEQHSWYWSCRCMSHWNLPDSTKHTCQLFDDYGKLAWEFKMIAVAADEQERAFKSAGMVESDPAHLTRLLERARAESQIIQQVTGELLGLPPSVDKSEELQSIAARVREKIGLR